MISRQEASKIASEIAGIENRIVLMTKFTPVPFANKLSSLMKIAYDKHKRLWYYDKNNGIWDSNAEQYLRTLIRKSLLGDEQQKKNYVEEIISYIKDVSFDEKFEVDENPNYIGFKNGVYNLEDKKFYKFNSKFRISSKIPINVNNTITECPKIDKFFGECIGEEYKDILYELLAYCLYKKYPYPKIFFIYGPSNTGKSKYIELIEKFLGKENYCSIEPQDIQKDPYATAQMLYKSANLCSDINYDSLDNINQVKKISGEDTVKIRNMYKEPYNGKIYAKQIFSTNKLPIVKEKTRAWYKRVYLLPFYNIIEQGNEDPFLMQKLTEEKELQGLAYNVLKSLETLKNRDFVFSHDINQTEVEKIYEKLSNPLLLFIEENCKVENGQYVFQYELKERFEVWRQKNHFPKISVSEINEYMRDRFVASNRSAFNGNKTYRVWSGLRWKGTGESSFNHFNHFNHLKKKVYIYRRSFKESLNR